MPTAAQSTLTITVRYARPWARTALTVALAFPYRWGWIGKRRAARLIGRLSGAEYQVQSGRWRKVWQ